MQDKDEISLKNFIQILNFSIFVHLTTLLMCPVIFVSEKKNMEGNKIWSCL